MWDVLWSKLDALNLRELFFLIWENNERAQLGFHFFQVLFVDLFGWSRIFLSGCHEFTVST
jgi:hypothetical protein